MAGAKKPLPSGIPRRPDQQARLQTRDRVSVHLTERQTQEAGRFGEV